MTLRRALENSRNLATAHLLEGGIDKTPRGEPRPPLQAGAGGADLSRVPALLSVRAGRPAGAADRSCGLLRGDRQRRPTADAVRDRCDRARRRGHLSAQVRRCGDHRVRSTGPPSTSSSPSCRASCRAAPRGRSPALAPYVAGKTGTSDDENDAWFVGFTNEVTVAVWVGYDNADGKRRTLGGGSTGGGLAVPIFASIIQAVWADVAPKTVLAPPSADAKRMLSCKSIDVESGEIASRRAAASANASASMPKARSSTRRIACWPRSATTTGRDGARAPYATRILGTIARGLARLGLWRLVQRSPRLEAAAKLGWLGLAIVRVVAISLNQSTLMLAALMTSPHLAISSR